MKEYKPRIADKVLKDKLDSKGAVLIVGAKWCGKTTTAEQVAKSVVRMQDPARKSQYIEMADVDPVKLLQGAVPRLIDEWQLAPKLWDAVRDEVDKRDDFGQFILTGSAVPPNKKDISHTGTGRISRMRMRPMSLYESQDSTGTVSLQGLFDGASDVGGTSNLDLDSLAFVICRGGWPKSLNNNQRIALAQAIDYFEAVVTTDISNVDNTSRSEEKTRKLMRSYARFVGSTCSLQTIISDLEENEGGSISKATIESYVAALNKIYVIEDSLAWNPNLRSKTAVRTSDTRYYTDPSIGTAALGLGPEDLKNDLNTMGLMLENLCVRDLRVYADLLGGNVYHYRDSYGLECDAVVHLRNGKYGLIEIKLGGEKAIADAAETLNKLSDSIDTSKMPAPSFKMVLTGIGDMAYKRKDGIFVVPIGCLKD